jgi:hypothetical protein
MGTAIGRAHNPTVTSPALRAELARRPEPHLGCSGRQQRPCGVLRTSACSPAPAARSPASKGANSDGRPERLQLQQICLGHDGAVICRDGRGISLAVEAPGAAATTAPSLFPTSRSTDQQQTPPCPGRPVAAASSRFKIWMSAAVLELPSCRVAASSPDVESFPAGTTLPRTRSEDTGAHAPTNRFVSTSGDDTALGRSRHGARQAHCDPPASGPQHRPHPAPHLCRHSAVSYENAEVA